jgi:hypothetical protein
MAFAFSTVLFSSKDAFHAMMIWFHGENFCTAVNGYVYSSAISGSVP